MTLDTGTMIFTATFIITGFHLVWFHALARLFAVRMNLLPTPPRSRIWRRTGAARSTLV